MPRAGNREKILSACMKMAGAKGCRFTMDDIEEASGLSRRTIYRYFPGKEEILIALLDETFLDIQEKQRKIFEAAGLSLPEKLWRLLTVKSNTEEFIHPESLYLYEKYSPRVYRCFQESYQREWSRVVEVLRQGMETGVFHHYSIELVISQLQSGMQKLCQGDFLNRNHFLYQQGLRQLAGLTLRGLCVRPEDLPCALKEGAL